MDWFTQNISIRTGTAPQNQMRAIRQLNQEIQIVKDNLQDPQQIQCKVMNKNPLLNIKTNIQQTFPQKSFFNSTINDFSQVRKSALDHQKMLQTFNSSKFNYEQIGKNIYKKEKKFKNLHLNIGQSIQSQFPTNRPQTTEGGYRQKKFGFQQRDSKLPDLKSFSILNIGQIKNQNCKTGSKNIQNIQQLLKLHKNTQNSNSISNFLQVNNKKQQKQEYLESLDEKDFNIQNEAYIDDSDKEDFSQIIVNSSHQKIARNKTQVNFETNLDTVFLSLFASDD